MLTYAQQTRRQENALAFLVSERISPTMNIQQIPLHTLDLTGGNYRNIRDLLRRQTEKEMADERIQRGRPLR
jgi:hypothetical protein